ncbi:hypothetical protein WN943_018685 [Citrus x changshan-huyou]
MGAMPESISAIVPKLDGLISVLSTADKELYDLQAKLCGEICKIEGLGDLMIFLDHSGGDLIPPSIAYWQNGL